MKQHENIFKFNMDIKQVKEAVRALYQFLEKAPSTAPALLDEHHSISLQLSLKKIPAKYKHIKIVLPHSLQHENTEVCLLTGDLNFRDPDTDKTVHYYRDLLKKNGIKGIAEILPLRVLRTEYKAYEAKIRLSKMYTMFLADDKLMGILPKYLGKHFIAGSKHPFQVNLRDKNLKKELNSTLCSTRCIISGAGTSCFVDIGHTGFSEDELVDNIMVACRKLGEAMPGTAANIHTIFVKMNTKPIALPIFASFGGDHMVKFEKVVQKRRDFTAEPEEVTTVEKGKVKVSSTGFVRIVRDKPTSKGKRPAKQMKKVKVEIVEADSSNGSTVRGPDTGGSTGQGSDLKGDLEQGDDVGHSTGESDTSEADESESDAGSNVEEDFDTLDEENALSTEEFDSNEEISDDSEELDFISDYSDDSSEESGDKQEANLKNLEHIRKLWEEGSDVELDSDQVSDTSLSDEETIIRSNIRDVKVTGNKTKTAKIPVKEKETPNVGKKRKLSNLVEESGESIEESLIKAGKKRKSPSTPSSKDENKEGTVKAKKNRKIFDVPKLETVIVEKVSVETKKKRKPVVATKNKTKETPIVQGQKEVKDTAGKKTAGRKSQKGAAVTREKKGIKDATDKKIKPVSVHTATETSQSALKNKKTPKRQAKATKLQ